MDSVGSQSPIQYTDQTCDDFGVPHRKMFHRFSESEAQKVYPSLLDVSPIRRDVVDSLGGEAKVKDIFFQWVYLVSKDKIKKLKLSAVSSLWGEFIKDPLSTFNSIPKLRSEFKETVFGIKCDIHEACMLNRIHCANKKFCPICLPNAKRFNIENNFWKNAFKTVEFTHLRKLLVRVYPNLCNIELSKARLDNLNCLESTLKDHNDNTTLEMKSEILHMRSEMTELKSEMTELKITTKRGFEDISSKLDEIFKKMKES